MILAKTKNLFNIKNKNNFAKAFVGFLPNNITEFGCSVRGIFVYSRN